MADPEQSNMRGGYFLDDDPGLFDATFFNLTSAEAKAMDPQQRLLLELSFEALENAGIPLEQIRKSDTAVFVGSSCRDYADLLQIDPERTELFQSTGTGQTMLSNRISYFYDLKGPSASIDTACSSSLVGLHLACNALRLGESRAAIVGGSNLILSHDPTLALSMLRFLSPDGRCYTYDSRANGFGRGEGASCLIIKPLAAALEDNDTIRAVIRNTGTNQDGKTLGITLPSGDAQVELIERTYKAVGLDPADTSFVEAHGTGTPAGDPIEAASLSKTFGHGRAPDRPLWVGSIKSNIGHLEGGSGIAGVLKAVTMLESNLILPNFDFKKPNPRIPMRDWGIEVPTTLRDWPIEDVHRASVNNFGFGGSNAHVIIDDACGYLTSRGLVGNYGKHLTDLRRTPEMTNGATNGYHKQGDRLFVLSAFDEVSAKQQAKSLAQYLDDHNSECNVGLLDDLAYTLGERRSLLPWRAAFSAGSLEQLLANVAENQIKFSKLRRTKEIGFIFTGQGAQWPTMGTELLHQYPVFYRSLATADSYLRALGAPWSLLDELKKDSKRSDVHSALVSQPLTTAIQVALVDLFASWNVRPARVTGHSSGEIAAAYCAGALSQESALQIAYHRGVVAQKLKSLRQGAMLAVGLSEEEVKPILARLTRGSVQVACINSYTNVTVSGDRPAISELLALLRKTDVFARELAVDVAYHSYHVEDIAPDYLKRLECIPVKENDSIEFHSSVTGRKAKISDLDARYWVSNMVNSVRFLDSIQSLMLSADEKKRRNRESTSAVDALVEIGPHTALQAPIKQILQGNQQLLRSDIQYMGTLMRKKSAIETCQNTAGQLFVHGYPVDIRAVNRSLGTESTRVLTNLPPYTWNHSTAYWADSYVARRSGQKAFRRSDILGVQIGNFNPLEPCWRNIVRASEIPWVNDHVIQTSTVYPAAGFLAMAIEAAHQHANARGILVQGYNLREISMSRALIIPRNNSSVETMLSLRQHPDSIRAPSDVWDEFCISSSTDGSLWTENCRGLISIQRQGHAIGVDYAVSRQYEQVAEFEKDCTVSASGKDVYKALDKLGLRFGPLFANLRNSRMSFDKCIADISIPDTTASMPAHFEYPFVIHPATLDSCIHAVFPIGAQHDRQDQGTPLPTYIDELYVSHNIDKTPNHLLAVYARSRRKDFGKKANNDIGHKIHSLTVFGRDQSAVQPSIIMNGLILTPLTKAVPDTEKPRCENIYYQTRWEPDPKLLTPTEISELGRPFRLPLEDAGQAERLQQVAFYYADHALNGLSVQDISDLQPHVQKFHTALSQYCKAVRTGRVGIFDTHDWLNADFKARELLCAAVDQTSYGILLCHVGRNLQQIMHNEVDPRALMMEDDRLERYYRANQSTLQCYQQAAEYIRLLGNQNPHLRILEVGAGTGSATLPILEALSGAKNNTLNFAHYDFTDLSPAFFEKAAEKLDRWSGQLSFQRLDIETDPVEQGYESGLYDVVVAANVLHATANVKHTLQRMRRLLKPGGKLVMVELTVDTIAASLIFGTLPGWWIGEEEDRQNGPLLSETQWSEVLSEAGFTGTDAILWDIDDPQIHHSSAIVSSIAPATAVDQKTLPPITIIIDSDTPKALSDSLIKLLSLAGGEYNISSLSNCNTDGRLMIVLSELTRSVLRNPTPNEYDAVKRIFLESAGVFWVTCGGLLESNQPDQNLVTGLARTIRAEKGDTTIVTLDMNVSTTLSDSDQAKKIFAILRKNFADGNVESTAMETEYAERNGVMLIPRILKDQELTNFVASRTEQPLLEDKPYCLDDHVVKAEIQTPGLLDTIHFVEEYQFCEAVPDGFVDVQVKASGINFRDVMSALGQIAPYPLGCECSGVVTAIGRSVLDLKPGDRVIANATDGCFCNAIRLPAEQVERIPDSMSFEVAAALPIVYLTAYWAVFKIARLRKNDSVLIHAASGGLGQALINLCQFVGADIFATVGTSEKRHLLTSQYNIPEGRIFSSRDNSFYQGIMDSTEGRGVDVVMNSLSGEALRLSWKCIAPFGRFIELGKRDFTLNTRLEMRQFEKNVSFTGLDLPLDSPNGEKKGIWRELMSMFESGSIRAPSPITTYGVSELEMALRTMQSGKHMGKLVLMPRPDEKVRVVCLKGKQQLLHEGASYLLIGGLGGIGRATALWMVKQGAKHLIFASPSGSDKPKAKETVALLQKEGTQVAVFKCDISSKEDLDHVLEQIRTKMPYVRGVIHAAMVPKADLFANLTLDDYNSIMRPKVDGIWNLHHAFPNPDSLDFFIMLSSIVGVSGNPSQAAYTAASVFLDAFADYRTHRNLPAVTLDLGRVVDIGIVADSISARRGVRDLWSRDIHEDEVMAMIESAILTPLRRSGSASSISGLKPWAPEADPVYQTPLFSHFRRAAMGRNAQRGDGEGGSGASIGLREKFRKASSLEDAVGIACTGVIAKTASLLMMANEDISAEKSLAEYGMDSLVAVEMRNWLLRELDATLPILELLENTSLRGLSEKIVKRSKITSAAFVENNGT